MADDAGFAAALTVRERVLNDALLFAYCRASFSRALKILVLGTGPPVSTDAFLAPPQVSCDGLHHVLVVSVEFRGKLTITESDGPHTMGVDGRLDIAVPPQFVLSN